MPKILIVTEKLLTGFDAPVLYAMYLDKPMRDHTLLQAIARVNRPYENEAQEMVKPHGFVLDFVGIFDKLEKALAFDSDEINAIVKDLKLLKVLFKNKMETKAPEYLGLIERNFNDKDVDTLIEHFRDKERRKEFFKEYKEIEMLYEIISPDAFLRPVHRRLRHALGDLSGCPQGLHQARDGGPGLPDEDQRSWCRSRSAATSVRRAAGFVEINAETIELIKTEQGGDATKVINLVKSIEKQGRGRERRPLPDRHGRTRPGGAGELRGPPDRHGRRHWRPCCEKSRRTRRRKKEQAEKAFDGLTYFVYRTLLDAEDRQRGGGQPEDPRRPSRNSRTGSGARTPCASCARR